MKNRLKQLRKTLNLKQREFAEKIGVTTGVVGGWESGSNKPGDARIDKICYTFKVRRDWLENGNGEMFEPEAEPKTPDDILRDAALALFRELSPRAQDALIAAMEEVSNDRINSAINAAIKKPTSPTPSENEKEETTPVEILVAMKDK